jgi:hypothetical protein
MLRVSGDSANERAELADIEPSTDQVLIKAITVQVKYYFTSPVTQLIRI